ncbi:fatty acid-binding protein, liver-like [Heterodontus francisci]|uniref:fatty acid-binding protein, liver-like n=1 Tax=Heterodontus francisci TaxID=7792 RepID=UPI00355AE6D0
MVEAFIGKWKLVKTENFDEYMKALGVNAALRKLGNRTKTITNISIDNDIITLETTSMVKSTKIHFKVGKEFDETTADDRKTKTTVTYENGQLVQAQRWNGRETTLVRELKDDKLILTCTIGDVVCIRTYQRVK